MADIFLSYSREDTARAQQIARALQAAGLQVFWDREIPPGQTWAEFLENKLNNCKRVLVLWSATSTQSQWVREEARMGRDRGKLIPVLLDNAVPPFGFGEVQAANLSDWNGQPNHPGWMALVSALRQAAGMPDAPIPAAPSYASSGAGYAGAGAGYASAPQASPIDYVKKCLALYVDGKGRARRAEYWWFAAFQFIVLIAASTVDMAVFGHNYEAGDPNMLGALASLALLAPGVSVTARRMHDVGLNGWLTAVGYLGSFVFGLGLLFLLVVAVIPGQPRDNQYGPDPKAV